MRRGSNIIPLHVEVQLSQHHLLKRPFFYPHWIVLVLLSKKSIDHKCENFILIIFHWSISYLYTSTHCFDYCHFVGSFKIRKCESFSFVLFFQDCFGLLRIPWTSMWILEWAYQFLQISHLEFWWDPEVNSSANIPVRGS